VKDITKIIGKRIKYFREKKGYSKTYLAKLSGVHTAWIGRLEQGKRETGKAITPSITTLQKIADALDIKIEDLLKGSAITKHSKISDKTILKEIKLLLKEQSQYSKQLFIQVARKLLKK